MQIPQKLSETNASFRDNNAALSVYRMTECGQVAKLKGCSKSRVDKRFITELV